jgi:hypothetical protein
MIDDVFCPFDQCSVDCVDVMDVLVRTWSSLVARYLDCPWKVGGKGGATRILCLSSSAAPALPDRDRIASEASSALQTARDASLTLESARDARSKLLPSRLLPLEL